MVGDNKILTVSYGTFSCTLEGFDDPFNTMKAIAEYFRDLAAGDRFFGAEPPQPDTDVLHRIAEQTIRAQVNAEVADNGLILRQAEPGAAQPPATTPEPVAEDVAPAERFGTNSVAEKLQRIRAVVANEAVRPAPYAEDEHAEDNLSARFAQTEPAPEAPVEDENETEIDLSGVMSSTDDTTAEAARAEAEEARLKAEAEAAEAKAAEEERARAEAEENARLAAEAEAKAAEEANADTETDLETEEEVDEAAHVVPEETSADTDTQAEDDAVESEAAEDTHDDETAEYETEEASDEPLPTPRRRIIVQKISRTDLGASPDSVDETSEDPSDLSPEAEAALLRELSEAEQETPVEDSAETAQASAEDKTDDAIAAALKASAEDAETTDAAEPDSDEDPEAEEAKADVETEVSDEDISESSKTEEDSAEAKDATSETEDEAIAAADDTSEADTDETAQKEDDHEATDAARAARIARRSIETEDEEAALERLMTMTGDRLENDESSVRRASIAHLKAAVAATKADSSLAEDAAAEDEREMDQYRDDLARVVKPGRTRPRSAGASRPRPSPLVLVSEQRIDTTETDAPAIAASSDVRPRRISHGNLAMQEEFEEEMDAEDHAGNIFGDEDAESFGEYATRHSALELPDMLEAAAAHYTWVENQAQFTRPMLMRKIAAISETHAVSREDGLRAFGTLLRQGAIVKDGTGKFAIATKSRFAPEAQSDDA